VISIPLDRLGVNDEYEISDTDIQRDSQRQEIRGEP
jgi:hypothetical protein